MRKTSKMIGVKVVLIDVLYHPAKFGTTFLVDTVYIFISISDMCINITCPHIESVGHMQCMRHRRRSNVHEDLIS